ncbi:MAG: hypothetical protein CMO26_02790 [Thiotrichales bacterium]|nr:hypothetical protein [Thiotrichales bacterium]
MKVGIPIVTSKKVASLACATPSSLATGSWGWREHYTISEGKHPGQAPCSRFAGGDDHFSQRDRNVARYAGSPAAQSTSVRVNPGVDMTKLFPCCSVDAQYQVRTFRRGLEACRYRPPLLPASPTLSSVYARATR